MSTTVAEFISTLRPEDPAEMPRLNSLASFWLCPSGELHDAGYTHHEFARRLGEDTDGLIAKSWLRLNISPGDGHILVQGRRPNTAQRRCLDDLRFSQRLSVVNDDGIEIMPTPEVSE
jgi:hypothetical protein